MKYFLILIILTACIRNRGSFISENKVKDHIIDFISSSFINDSGAITKKQVDSFHLKSGIRLNTFNSNCKNDTCGKYFRNKEHFMICLSIINPFENLFDQNVILLTEVNYQNKQIQYILYFHGGNLEPCWTDGYSEFGITASFYRILFCPKPIGQYETHDYIFFKTLDEINYTNSILQLDWHMLPDNQTCTISSELISYNVCNLVFRYTKTINQLDSNYKVQKIMSKNEFVINYLYKNKKWIMSDSSTYKQLYQ